MTPLRPLSLLALLALAACSQTPAYREPAVTTPTAWQSSAVAPLEAPLPGPGWWEAFGSPELDALVTEARANNRDLLASLRRIDQARAQLKIARAGLYPTLGASGSAGRSDTWSGSNQPNSFQGMLSAGYEVDLWGQVAAGVQSAEAGLQGTIYDAAALDLVLQGDVATAYLQYLALNDRLAVARSNLAAAESLLRLIEVQYAAGAVSALELAQQRQQVSSIAATIPDLEGQRQQTANALTLLLGLPPNARALAEGSLKDLRQPWIGPGLPASLLERRPDLRSAEAALIAANANIGAARAALLPSIQLTGSGGAVSAALSSFLRPDSLLYSLAASLTAPIFQGGALEGQVELSEARYAELVESYQQAALSAFRDVANALTALSSATEQERVLIEAADQARQAYELASLQYREGAVDFLTVLTAQRTQLSAEDSLVLARLGRLSAAVDLARALGGGWVEEADAGRP